MKPIKAKIKRNQRLIKDYQSGKYTILDLSFKYRISPQRIHQIRKKLNIPPLKIGKMKNENISGEDNRV